MNRARPLSDEYITSECAAYRSVPMHYNVTKEILRENQVHNSFGVK